MQFTTFNAGKLAIIALLAQLAVAHPTFEMEKRQTTPAILMGAAAGWGAIAASTLTNVSNTRITGSCGTSPGTEITGFPPGVCTKTNSAGGIAADNAEAACLNAYNNAAAKVPTAALRASDLGRGLTLPPGVYTFPTSAATLTGTLTLDGATNRRGQWIFQITTTFTASAASQIRTINGAQACNVYFIVGSSANVQAGTKLVGNILAYTSISASDAASNNGSWCALNGAVTLINNALTAQSVCST